MRWWPLWAFGSALGLALTLWFSLRGGGPALGWANADKLQHVFGYALLAVWFSGLVNRSQAWRVALGCVAFGIAMELLQGWLTSTRQADPMDALANAGGVAAGLALARTGLDGWAGWIERRFGRAA